MRWEQLFSDLDAWFDELADAEMMAELADRERAAAGAISVVERMGGAIGRPLRVRTTAGMAITGALLEIGPDWLLIQEGPGREVLVALTAVTIVEGLAAATGPTVGGVKLRLNLRFALRGIARDRSPVAIVVCGGVGEPTVLHRDHRDGGPGGRGLRRGGAARSVGTAPRRECPIDRPRSTEGCRFHPGTTAGVISQLVEFDLFGRNLRGSPPMPAQFVG